MSMRPETIPAGPAPALAVATRFSGRITATWWYTMAGVLFLEGTLVFLWVAAPTGHGHARTVTIAVAGMVWWVSTVPLLRRYRHAGSPPGAHRWAVLVPLLIAAACGAVVGAAAGLWMLAVVPLVQSALLLHWPPGLRVRVAAAATVLLVVLWLIDARGPAAVDIDARGGWLLGAFCLFIPVTTVLSLWWWDVLVTLDRARVSEANLGATRERLRVATDVHDLQGHHLQVIALQLELAERLLAKQDPDAAMAQLRAARSSVDEARQGTRDLATRFRSVPLLDELANAVDLLRAAGTEVEATVDPAADAAPAEVLGPVIRETTTNVLRHGGGRWARLALSRSGAVWRYEISNHASGEDPAGGGGSGLEGVARRVAEAGGAVEVRRGKQDFTVVVTVPAETVPAQAPEGAPGPPATDEEGR
ncbi:histidine kinase [Leucobacter allii]|uniref:sensor histidine kinase n=1 Tax=Leucobacter allii TaxID=2932247 RepID=UPI001FD16F6C|nr:histidine kinase [Leucobacter allii]UOR00902.1 histidine kinase [Leucobacter allii]